MIAVNGTAPDADQEEGPREVAVATLLAALDRCPDPALPRDPFDLASETA